MEASEPRVRLSLPRKGWALLAVGLVVREALSFWTGHPYDLESFLRTGFVVAHGADPYVALAPPVPGVSFGYLNAGIALASYPPFWPELLGGIYRFWEDLGAGNRFVLYFLLKQPGIAADLGTAYLLWRIARRAGAALGTALGALGFWSLFPYAIAISAVWGQFDAILVMVVLLGVEARTALERNLLYGVGILVKWLTVVFLPLSVFRERRRTRLSVLAAAGLVGGLGILPFVFQGWSLTEFLTLTRNVSHGNNWGMNYVFLLTYQPVASTLGTVPGLYSALGFAWVPAAVVAGYVAARWVRSGGVSAEVRALLFVLAAVLLVRWGLYEQYFLYLFALLVLDLAVAHPGRRGLFRFTVAVASAQLLANNDLGLRFLTPLDPGLLTTLYAAEAGPAWGVLRTDVLLVLAVIMTITLVQLLMVLASDEPTPRPWILLVPSRIAARFARWRRKVAPGSPARL